MKRALLTLALIAAAGTASAQSMLNTGAAAPPGGRATLDTDPTFNRIMRAHALIAEAPAIADAYIANAPAPRLTGPAGTAQRLIEQDGYQSVQNLQQGADGRWHGTALRGNAQVQVSVDRAGRVSAQ